MAARLDPAAVNTATCDPAVGLHAGMWLWWCPIHEVGRGGFGSEGVARAQADVHLMGRAVYVAASGRPDFAAALARVPSDTARRAAMFRRAVIAHRGTGGEDVRQWLHRDGQWLLDNGYEKVPCAESEVADEVELVGFDGFVGADEQRARLADIDGWLEDEYVALAGQARDLGLGVEFTAAVDALRAKDPHEIDDDLYKKMMEVVEGVGQ